MESQWLANHKNQIREYAAKKQDINMEMWIRVRRWMPQRLRTIWAKRLLFQLLLHPLYLSVPLNETITATKKKRMNEIYKQKWEGRREPAKAWQDSDTEIYTRMNRKYPFCSAIAVLESKKIPPVKCFTFDYFLFLLLPPAHSYFFPMIYYCFYAYANKYDMKRKQGEEGCKRHIVGRTIDGKFRFSIANKMKIFTFIKLGCPCKPGVPSSF